MVDKLIRIVDKQPIPSTMSWDMIQILEESIKEIKDGKQPNKGIILFLDTSGEKFDLSDWKKAGVLNSEAIALVELFKVDLIDLLIGRQ